MFEVLTLGGMFLGVKNNSKNFGNKKIVETYFWLKSEKKIFLVVKGVGLKKNSMNFWFYKFFWVV